MGLKSRAKHSLPAALTGSAPAHKHARTAKRSQSPAGGSGGAEPGGFCRCFPPSSAASSSCNTTLPSHGSSAAKASQARGHTCKSDPKTRGKPPPLLWHCRGRLLFSTLLCMGGKHTTGIRALIWHPAAPWSKGRVEGVQFLNFFLNLPKKFSLVATSQH